MATGGNGARPFHQLLTKIHSTGEDGRAVLVGPGELVGRNGLPVSGQGGAGVVRVLAGLDLLFGQ